MRRLLLLLVLLTAALGLATTSAQAAGRTCPKQRGTLATDELGRVWHRGRSLYACTTSGERRPATKRMGPWTPSTRVSFDGATVAWTTRVARGGTRVDRLWAGFAGDGSRWLSGAQAVPAAGDAPAAEARVLALRSLGSSVAWVTDGSQLAVAAESPDDYEPTTLDTPSVTLRPDAGRVLAGAWPDTPAADLAATLELEQEPSEGDDCGGTEAFTASVRPTGSAAPAGVRWASSYVTRSAACNT